MVTHLAKVMRGRCGLDPAAPASVTGRTSAGAWSGSKFPNETCASPTLAQSAERRRCRPTGRATARRDRWLRPVLFMWRHVHHGSPQVGLWR